MMNNLFFIPARKNSKGIKDKNISLLNNKPLIKHTIDFVKKFNTINKKKNNFEIFISTDSKNILKFCGSNYKFKNYLRPKTLAKDNSNVVDSILHALEWLKKNNFKQINNVILLQPTNPIRDVLDLKKMLKYYSNKKLKSLVSVIPMKEHPYECIEMLKNDWKYLAKPKKQVTRRQDYKSNYYFIDGSYYIIDVKFLKKFKKIVVEKKTNFYLLNKTWPVDIDEYDDLIMADMLLSKKNNRTK